MNSQMSQLSHTRGNKASLYIDPSSRSPPWPKCGHSVSFKSTSRATPGALTREETIWLVYLDWILYGKVDESVGEYKRWTVSDERDVEAERAAFEQKGGIKGLKVPDANTIRKAGTNSKVTRGKL